VRSGPGDRVQSHSRFLGFGDELCDEFYAERTLKQRPSFF
jgi:hypothetical protein